MIEGLVALTILGSPIVEEPPARFDHAFRGTVAVMYGSEADMIARCRRMVFACALIGPGRCMIVIWNDLPDATKQTLIRHERAHCNGWPAHHPR